MYGYLIYDTLFTLMFYEAVGTVAFLLHHCLGLTCCCFGLYFNKMALFGTAIQVFFESTTPLLHLMGCLKLMGRQGTSSYTATGETSWILKKILDPPCATWHGRMNVQHAGLTAGQCSVVSAKQWANFVAISTIQLAE